MHFEVFFIYVTDITENERTTYKRIVIYTGITYLVKWNNAILHLFIIYYSTTREYSIFRNVILQHNNICHGTPPIRRTHALFCYLCLFAHSGVQIIKHVVLLCFIFLRVVYPMLPVSLDL
jgi:hypothetical protein